MVTRRYLRIKVLQALYAVDKNPQIEFAESEKQLTKVIQSCQTLTVYFLTILPEIARFRAMRLEELKEKNIPTAEDLNPNLKFLENRVIKQIEENKFIQQYCRNHKIDWSDRYDFIAQIYKEIANSAIFSAYMENPTQSYEEDKRLILAIIEEVFAESQLLHWFLEEKNVHWFDDYNDALLAAYKNIEKYKEIQIQPLTLINLFKDQDEIEFYKALFKKTMLYDREFQKRIDDKLLRWESDRLLEVDVILLKMALCELTHFPTIPIKVTINEYIELAKLYSSRKSGIFINGVLDAIILDYKNEGLLNKMGRGLIN